MIDAQGGKALVDLARDAILSVFEHRDVRLEAGVRKRFAENLGVFVTLTMRGDLRGCIGYVEPVFPLYEGIVRAARAAAFEDPRFPALGIDEIRDVVIEISVLGKPVPLAAKDPKLVEIGRHGLIIESKHRSGLLLPQVFTEYHCSSEQALMMVCEKAGLPSGAWKEPSNRLYTFEAQVIHQTGR